MIRSEHRVYPGVLGAGPREPRAPWGGWGIHRPEFLLFPNFAISLPDALQDAYRGGDFEYFSRLPSGDSNPSKQPLRALRSRSYSVKMQLGVASTSSLNENPVGGVRVAFLRGGITNISVFLFSRVPPSPGRATEPSACLTGGNGI